MSTLLPPAEGNPEATQNLQQAVSQNPLSAKLAWTGANGREISVADFKGQPVVLAFFPTTDVHDWAQQLETYDQWLRSLPGAPSILDLSDDTVWCELRGDDSTCHAPLVRQPAEGKLAEHFGVVGQCAVVVLDEEGEARWKHVAGEEPPSLGELATRLTVVKEQRSVSRRELLVASMALTLVLTVFLPVRSVSSLARTQSSPLAWGGAVTASAVAPAATNMRLPPLKGA